MGANIYWQPIKPTDARCITPGLRSKFVAALELPRELEAGDIAFLRGVAAGEPDFQEAIDELCEAIHKHERVRVWAEY